MFLMRSKMSGVYLLAFLLFSMFQLASVSVAEERYLNLVAFQANKPSYNFESIVTGSMGELVSDIEKNAHVVFATHTTALKAKDIINLQVDVMRMTKNNSLANSGLNCRFIFGDESDEESYFYSISGVCDRLTGDERGTHREQVLIKRKMLSDPSSVFHVWMKFYEDRKAGVAFYVDID
ncbi:MAG: hypothetical protein Q9M44_01820 [Ghiorsea sp.]|nr:hypothetical protein [Ghiorsea sp.]